MNLQYYIEFLDWRLTCAVNDNLLQTSLYITLRSVEMVALLRVLSILHIAVCMPVRWLAGNTENLAQYDFGAVSMGRTLDMLEDAFIKISSDGALLLDEDFVMNIFSDIVEEVEPFDKYLNFMFNEKSSNPVGTWNRENKVKPYQLLRKELFYPTRKDIQQTYDLTCQLACEAASIFLMEFRDPTKATSKYLSSISRPKSWCSASDETKSMFLNVSASNSVSEANHASYTVGLKLSGTIRLDHVCAEGQTRHNNDFGRGHEVLVKAGGRQNGNVNGNIGTYTTLCEEHQRSIIQAALENAHAIRRRFDDALARYAEGRREKEELAMQKKIDASREEYIVGVYFYEMYHSDRCWKNKIVARAQFGVLSSEAARLRAVKEQHLIRTLGLGWMQAHHPWSKNGKVYGATDFLTNLCLVVIPLAKELIVPDDSPVKLATAPDLCTLGTLSAIGEELETKCLETVTEFKREGREERDRRENDGLGDR
jgi:hypothetical protein